MVSPATRRWVRFRRFSQTYPLWYAGAAILGLVVIAAGWLAGRPAWIRGGAWLTAPFFLLLCNLVFLLAISAVANLGIWVWKRISLTPRGEE